MSAVQSINWSCGWTVATGAGERPAQPINAAQSATIARIRIFYCSPRPVGVSVANHGERPAPNE